MTRNFKDDLIERRPDVAEYLEENELRVLVAENLRAARRRAGLTQTQLSEVSGMTQPVISGMESPTGPMPTIPNMDKYMKACGEQMVLGFPAEKARAAVIAKGKVPVKGKDVTASILDGSRTVRVMATKKARIAAGGTVTRERSALLRIERKLSGVIPAAAGRSGDDDHDHHAAWSASPYQHGVVVGMSLMIEEDPGNGATPEKGAGTSD